MRRTLSLVFLFSFPVWAFSPIEIQNQIRNQMAQRHPQDSASFWGSLGSDALPILKQMFSESKSAYEKSWLIDGMGYFNDPSVGSLLESEIQSSENAVTIKKMLGALIQSQGDRVFDFVEPYLKNSDPHIRLAVAQNMKRNMSSDQAKKRVAAFSAQEKLDWVKTALSKEPESDHLQKVDSGNAFKASVVVALQEKAWAGEWKGNYLSATGKPASGSVFLTLLNEKATPAEQKWKVELKLDQQSKFEIKGKEFEIVYYHTQTTHWLEVRNPKEDKVFIGRRADEKTETPTNEQRHRS